MIEIKLTKNYVTIIDDIDKNMVTQFKWHAHNIGNSKLVYAARKPANNNIYMHRVIIGAKDGQIVDHINGNSLDNRRENLRITSCSINIANSKTNINSTSGYSGVTIHKTKGILVRISRDGIRIESRPFNDVKTAALLRDELARLLYPEGTFLNLPDQQCPEYLVVYARKLFNRYIARKEKRNNNVSNPYLFRR